MAILPKLEEILQYKEDIAAEIVAKGVVFTDAPWTHYGWLVGLVGGSTDLAVYAEQPELGYLDLEFPGVTITAANGTGPFTFSVLEGTLPPGLSLVGNTIVGTPTEFGTWADVVIQVEDSTTATATTAPLFFEILPALDPDVDRLVRRLDGQLIAGGNLAILNLVQALKVAGIWAKLDTLYVPLGLPTEDYGKNWVQAQYDLDLVTGTPQHQLGVGILLDGTTSFETRFNPGLLAQRKLARNSATVFVLAEDVGTEVGTWVGTSMVGISQTIPGEADFNITSSTTENLNGLPTSDLFLSGSRLAWDGTELYVDGELALAGTAESENLSLDEFLVGTGLDGILAAAGWGSWLTEEEHAALNVALHDFILEINSALATHLAAGRVMLNFVTNPTARQLEHTAQSKSFFAYGSWWGVVPSQSFWGIYHYDGPVLPYEQGGWTIGGDTISDAGNNSRMDIAWDGEKLYCLRFALNAAPELFVMEFNEETGLWERTGNPALGLTGARWVNHNVMKLLHDGAGRLMIFSIGPTGADAGLHVAWASGDFSSWSQATIDSDVVRDGGDNGDARVDAVLVGGSVGLVYSHDGAVDKDWSYASHAVDGSYGTGWNTEVITSAVTIDNHVSAVSDGSKVYAVVKDASDDIWLLAGVAGSWDSPVLVHDAVSNGPSRACLTITDDGRLFVIMQQRTNNPYGDVYIKIADADAPSFDTSGLGFPIIEATEGNKNLTDPQRPLGVVGTGTGYKFPVFVKNFTTNQIWYNEVLLTVDYGALP